MVCVGSGGKAIRTWYLRQIFTDTQGIGMQVMLVTWNFIGLKWGNEWDGTIEKGRTKDYMVQRLCAVHYVGK